MFDKVTSVSLLYDFYGNLLSDRQREVVGMHCDDDLSLAEIAEELGISRQGVHDALKNGRRALDEYEEKLGMVKRFSEETEAVREIDRELTLIIEQYSGDEVLKERLSAIKDIIDKMEL